MTERLEKIKKEFEEEVARGVMNQAAQEDIAWLIDQAELAAWYKENAGVIH